METTQPSWEARLLESLKAHAQALEADLVSTVTRQSMEQRALTVLEVLQPLIAAANPAAGLIVAEAITGLQKLVTVDKTITSA